MNGGIGWGKMNTKKPPYFDIFSAEAIYDEIYRGRRETTSSYTNTRIIKAP